MEWQLKCLICEKHLGSASEFLNTLPNIEGGTVTIDFGYGSSFDDLNGCCRDQIQHQACICDNCYETKIELTRPVIVQNTFRWKILDANYRKRKRT